MKDETAIGIIYRHGTNDYELYVMNFTVGDEDYINSLIFKYAERNDITCCRGEKHMTLEDANVDYWETQWEDRYQNTGDPEDIVPLSVVFQRYYMINGTYKGFEEYVNSGFMSDNGEIEYEKI